MFNKDSGLVKIWVSVLSAEFPKYTLQDVPDIGNLREVIKKELANKGRA